MPAMDSILYRVGLGWVSPTSSISPADWEGWLAGQGVKWPECGGSWGVDGCKKAPWPAAGGCLAALGRGLGTWRGDNDPDVEIRARAAPCGNLPVFNVGKRTGGGQVLPNGNIALPAPVKKFLNRDEVNLLKFSSQLFRSTLNTLLTLLTLLRFRSN